jgi:hypothetical protein
MFEKRFGTQTVLLCVLLLVLFAKVGSAEPLYDDFSAPFISKDKWFGGEGVSALGRDVARAIENGKLRLKHRSVGFTASDSGLGINVVFLALLTFVWVADGGGAG